MTWLAQGLHVCLIEFCAAVCQWSDVVRLQDASELGPMPGAAGLARPLVALENLPPKFAPLAVCAAPLYGSPLEARGIPVGTPKAIVIPAPHWFNA